MTPEMSRVLARLEHRSEGERAELERLNAAGAGHTRAAAGQLMLDVGPDVGRLLAMLVRCRTNPTVVEVGSSVGYSTIWLADAVRAAGGRVHSIEPDTGKVAQARDNLAEAGLAEYVEVIEGTAADVLPRLPGPYDVVIIDHWKDLYIPDFDLAWKQVAVGGVVVADNILVPQATRGLMGEYVKHVRSVPGAWSQTLPLGDGVEVTIRTGEQ
ncbi:O-methyltransferase [Streptantibioticus ferralitis]|uniref:Class I SAM-dependent methyltransferase n=1 Tax=Streptantibioticus ferralitis TaxID=236510 RepID=A0ABT5ZB60_9ACTN|nr:class I SAM-dependent methyltransferase [Streptantibioticus ferralitis]MDF2261087.1 class I SAM-dependent methyltransferase [Streptantibioticus ferralitis]